MEAQYAAVTRRLRGHGREARGFASLVASSLASAHRPL